MTTSDPQPAPRTLNPRTSTLLQTMITNDRFHVTDYFRHGAYPNHRREKDEVEAYVAHAIRVQQQCGQDLVADELQHYVRAMFPADRIATARASGTFDRLLAFAALQRDLDEALYDLEEASLGRPSPDDPILDEHPELFGRLDKDGLLVLEPGNVDGEALRAAGVVRYGNTALYPHPHLAPMRELVGELIDLVGTTGVTVGIALHPFRMTTVAEVPTDLLLDYWHGIKVTVDNLDSLDPHDTGVRTFHAARQDDPRRVLFPLLGTWFDWERRSRHDPADPVKRLYIREVRPTVDRQGERLVAALNRELHSERDTAARRFTHTDGKICSYPAHRYTPSVVTPDADPGHPAQSRKLWRVDGPLTNEQWRTLAGFHFRGNELIEEHFEAAFPPSRARERA